MNTLIINKRQELPKVRRIIWDLVTVLLWLGFIYLWKPVLIIFYKIITAKVPAEEIADWIFDNISSVTFEHAVVVLVATPVILFILSRLSRHQAPSEHLLYRSEDYSNYFRIENEQLVECTKSQLVTVYFDQHGHITELDNNKIKELGEG
jgi:biofilm PGA synthesis protein PgaD